MRFDKDNDDGNDREVAAALSVFRNAISTKTNQTYRKTCSRGERSAHVGGGAKGGVTTHLRFWISVDIRSSG